MEIANGSSICEIAQYFKAGNNMFLSQAAALQREKTHNSCQIQSACVWMCVYQSCSVSVFM